MPNDYLINAVRTSQQVFERKRKLNKFLAFGLKLAMAILSAGITVLLGLNFPGKNESLAKNIALCISAFSTVIATWDAFFQHRTLWIRHTITANRLRCLLDEIRYRTAANGGTLPDQISDHLFDEFQEIAAETDKEWEIMKRQEKANATHRTEQTG